MSPVNLGKHFTWHVFSQCMSSLTVHITIYCSIQFHITQKQTISSLALFSFANTAPATLCIPSLRNVCSRFFLPACHESFDTRRLPPLGLRVLPARTVIVFPLWALTIVLLTFPRAGKRGRGLFSRRLLRGRGRRRGQEGLATATARLATEDW